MALSFRGKTYNAPKFTQTLSESFLKPGKRLPESTEEAWGDRVLPKEERKAAMDSLDAVEVKWSKAGLVLPTLVAPILSIYLAANHGFRISKVHGHKVAAPLQASWLLIGGIVLVLCLLGFIALRRRRRTMVAFTFFIVGLACIPLLSPMGFALLVLGGWLMMRAYRINKYGTPIAKVVAKQAASRPPRRERKAAASAPAKPSGYKAPTSNKRYTPKAPPRKKVAKPVE